MKTLNRKLIRDLYHLHGQVLALVAVIACGIASYVTMHSTYQSLLATQTTYYQNYRFSDLFAQMKRAPESITAKIGNIPGVAHVQTRIVVEVTLDVPGLNEPATGRIISIPEKQTKILNDLFIRKGRYIDAEKQDEVLISEAFAEANRLNIGDRINSIINGRWKQLNIVGIALSPEYVYEIRGVGSIFPDNKRFGIIWMNRNMLGPAFNLDGAFNDLVLSLSPGANEAEIITNLDRLLEPYGGFGAYGRSEQISNRFLTDEIAQNKVHGFIIPIIFLGVAIFLLHIVLSRLVNTQREQIAVLKAFGYSDSDIGLHYLKFSLVVVLFGSVLGIIAGLWFGSQLTNIYTLFYRFPVLRYEAGPELIAFAVLISIVSASLGAFAAVRKVISLPPAESMRAEPPEHYRPLLIERLGLHLIFSAKNKMIIRNLERRPVKALLSILALSLSVAILVIGRYSFDAVNYLIDLQFNKIQREDITLIFNNPLSNRARYDLKHLPGVLRSETFRTVAVRLRSNYRTRRISILGLESSSELRQLINTKLETIDLPADGIVLTSKLAELLNVSPGSMLTVEVLEGNRLVSNVSVIKVVDEPIGLSAYMEIHALNRLLREGDAISGAYLLIDPLFTTSLYRLLKQQPVISGISIKEASLESFKETIAKSMAISTMVIVIFASIIAFGMVYNEARIALSERGRELASLRVLGFTQSEIAYLLLGEQAILTLLSIPPGFVIGYGTCILISSVLDTELFRFPLILSDKTYAFAFIVVVIAALLSGLLVWRRLKNLDLIAVLKTRE